MFLKFTGDEGAPQNADLPTGVDGQALQPVTPTLPRLESKPQTHVFRDPPIGTVTAWDTASIADALNSHVLGQFLASSQLVDALTGDDRIASVLNTRILALLGLPFDVIAAKSGDKAATKAQRQIAARFDQMVPEDQIAQFMRWGIMQGFALGEIVWRPRKGQWIPQLRTWHPQLVYYRIDIRRYVAITMDGPVEITPGDGKWVLYAPHGEYRGWMNGAVRTCSVPWLGRQYAFRDWLRHSERLGMPIIGAKVPSRANVVDKDRFHQSLSALGGETTVEIPQGEAGEASFGLELIEAKTVAEKVFGELLSKADTLISCAILGQNLTTEVQGGSYAAATVHGRVRQDYLEADAETLSTCLQQQLLRPYCAYNFEAGPAVCPTLQWDTVPPDDKKAKADALAQVAYAVGLLAEAGVKIDVRRLADEYDLPLLSDAPPGLPPPKFAPGAGGSRRPSGEGNPRRPRGEGNPKPNSLRKVV